MDKFCGHWGNHHVVSDDLSSFIKNCYSFSWVWGGSNECGFQFEKLASRMGALRGGGGH